ncbi:MAG: hypothetical protein HXX13_14440 [Bacteroidetes bacterium]|nr:hypothetical protein [Bacteroidota bacterium]
MNKMSHVYCLAASRIKDMTFAGMIGVRLFTLLFIIITSLSLSAQDVVYWRAAAPNGEWEWGTDCTFAGTDGNWHYTTSGLGERKRPDNCIGIANIIHFDNTNQSIMNLNSLSDYTVNRMEFDAGTSDRTFNSNASRNLYFKQNAGNAKIENNTVLTTQTFNVNVNIDASSFMEINPNNGFLVFNNPVVNNSPNPINLYGFQQVTFNGDIMGSAGITINNGVKAIYNGVSKSYSGATTINSGTTLQISSNQALNNIILNAGGTLTVDNGVTLTINGSWTGGGTIINNGTIILVGVTNFPGAATTVNSMNNLGINRAGGVTLDKALTVSGILTLSNGILTTSAANLLTLANTATTAISGGSVSSFINGPVKWNLPSNLLAGTTYVFPIGKGVTYLPMSVVDPLTGAGAVTITAEAFAANCGGTASTAAGVALSSLSATEYWTLTSTGALTNHKLSLGRQTALGTLNRIGRSTTVNGTYSGVGGTPSGNNIINSNNTSAGATQFFVMASGGPVNVANANAASNGDYATLQAAFASINGQVQTGFSIVVTINGNTTETGTAVLNAGAWTSLNLYPSGAYTVTGNIASQLVNLNGTKNVIFDGSIAGSGSTRDLTFSNTNTGGSTLQFIADANSNIIRNCVIKGNEISPASGVVVFSTGSASGNDNNTINNCNITQSTSTPANAIYSAGTSVAVDNSAISITNNDIQDYFLASGASNGILIASNSSAWTISGNKFFQTAARTTTAASQVTAINIITASGVGYQINTNIIGFNSSSGTAGTYSVYNGAFANKFTGIEMTVGALPVSNVQGNTIAGIQLTTTPAAGNRVFNGISILAGSMNVGTTTGNIIGASSGTGSITINSANSNSTLYGIYASSTGTISINNNTIAGINTSSAITIGHKFSGITTTGSAAYTVSNNFVGSVTANSIAIGISTSTTSSNIAYGIYNSSSGSITMSSNEIQNLVIYNTTVTDTLVGIFNYNAAGTVSLNNIHNLTATTTTGATSLIGIFQYSNTAGALPNITNNQIHDLSTVNTTAASDLAGINSRGGSITTANLLGNKIYNLSSTITGTGIISGIIVWGGATYNIANNLIGNLTTSAASSGTSSIFGIQFPNTSTTALNVYFNSIYLNASSSTAGNFSTAGIYHTYHATSAALTLKNNIIVNLSTPKGTGRTVAFQRSAATGLGNYVNTSNNNLFYAGTPGASNLIYYDGTNSDQTLATFQSRVTPRETASVTENPPFLSTVGATATFLHFSNSCGAPFTLAESGGTAIASPFDVDFDAEARFNNPLYTGGGSAPDIGADEFGISAIEVTATAGTLGPTLYSNLKAAFDKINSGKHQGAITIRVLCSTMEPASCVLNASGGSSSYTSVVMYPAFTGLSITGNLSAPLIDLSGADNVTIDGRVALAGAADLLLSNTSASATTGTSTIRMTNGATGNTVQYCNVTGSSLDAASGIFIFGTNGNSNDRIDHCNITNAGGNRPVNVIYSQGATTQNSDDIISNNNIYNFFNTGLASYGININATSTKWTISGNSFYENTVFTPSAAVNYNIIYVAGSVGNTYTISDNYFGGSAALCSGTWTKTGSGSTFYCLNLNPLLGGAGAACSIQNNRIQKFDWTNTATADWYAMNITTGNVNIGTVTGNLIGDDASNNLIQFTSNLNSNFYGIYYNSPGSGDIQNNKIGSIAVKTSAPANNNNFYGIIKSNTAGSISIHNNIIGSATQATSISVASLSSGNAQTAYGIKSDGTGTTLIDANTIANITNATSNVTAATAGFVNAITTTAGANTISNNIIHDLKISNANNAANNTASVTGICQTNTTAGQAESITGNTIYNLNNNYGSFGGNVIGLYYNGPSTGTNVVSKNFIYGLTVLSNLAAIYGIKVNAGTTVYSNNIVSLGGNTQTNLYGIYENGAAGNNNSLLFNTVNISGTPAAGATNSYALYNALNASTRDFRNNLLNNSRSGGTGRHYAIYLAGTTGLTINYNDYFASGVTGGTLGFLGGNVANLAAWKTATGQDANSLSNDPGPGFPGGTGANLTDFIPVATTLSGISISGYTDDIDATPRCVPTMGAQEKSSIPAQPGTITSSGTACSGGSLTYSISPVTYATTYTWSVPAGWSITSGQGTVSISVTAGASGGTISVTAGNDCGTSVARSLIVSVNPLPTVSNSNAASTCSGSALSINLNASIPLSTFTWTIGTVTGGITGQSASSGGTINQTLTNPSNSVTGQVEYIVTATSPAGCAGIPKSIFVSVEPLPAVTGVAPLTYCSGVIAPAINFTASVAGSSFTWTSSTDIGFGTSGTGNIASFTPSNHTGSPIVSTISVWATSPSICVSASPMTFTITVNPAPDASVTSDYCSTPGSIILTAQPSPPGYTYQWYNSGTIMAGYTTQQITVNTAGMYSVVVTNSFGCTTTALTTVSVELVTNGNFTAGNVGFTSDYTYWPDIAGNNELVPDNGTNGYSVGTNGQNFHPNFWGQDHTNNSVGPRNFMLVNGHGTLTIWKETLSVTPNTDYYFSAWAISLNNVGPFANLKFSINGSQIGSPTGPLPSRPTNNNPPFNWTQFYGNWNSGASTTALLEIVDLETAAGGNDFGLDDISFGSVSAATAVVTLSANGGGPVCAGSNLQLNANLTGGMAPFVFSWTGPNGFISNIQNPIITGVTAANSGVYTLSLSDGYGCPPQIITINVNVISPAVAPTSVQVDRNNFCSDDPGNITLTATGGSGTTLQWYTGSCGGTLIGTGSPLVIASPAVTTTYYARWQNTCGASGCANVTVNVNSLPTAPTSITTPLNPVCEGSNVTLTANGGNGGTGSSPVLNWYAGSCGGTPIGSGTSITITATTTTTYYARWESSCGITSCASLLVTVNPLPVAPTSATVDRQNFCEDDAGNITLTANGGSGNTCKWYIGSCGGTLVGTGTSLVIPSPIVTTTYFARWENGCGNSSCASITDTVLTLPIAPTSITASANPICAAASLILTAVGGNGGTGLNPTVRWYTGSCGTTLVGTGTSITISAPASNTTYYARWESGCGSSSCASILININPLPVAPTWSSAPLNVCAPQNGVVYTINPVGGATSYIWSYSNTNAVINPPTTSTTATLDFSSVAAVTLGTLTVQAVNGCGTGASLTRSIRAWPQAIVSAGPAQIICGGQTVLLAGTMGGSATSITWSGGTGSFAPNANTLNAVYTPSAAEISAGFVTLTITTNVPSGTCPAASDNITITILPAPSPVIAGPNSVCAGSTGNIYSTTAGKSNYAWSISAGGSITSGGTSTDNTATVTWSSAGPRTISVNYTDPNGCSAVTPTVYNVTVNALPTATISYAGSPFCATGTVAVTRTGTPGGTYSAPAGLSINAGTGQINLAASAAGTYTVTYNFTSGGCSNIATASVTINALPVATISYTGSPFCATGTINVNQTGTAGGTYTSPAGLSINAVSGQINLATSTPGTYIVTYSFTSGGCSNTTTTSVTINALPSASISYTGSPFCATGTVNVNLTGTAGGNYSAPAGLSINAVSGQINLATSTPGTYTVTYSFTSGGCSNTTTTSVTINALPSASISYTGSPFCATGTVNVNLTGTAGGNYSAPAGLSINAVSGQINLATSTPGTYTVTYSFASGGCSNTTTTSVTINALPNSYNVTGGGSYCAGGTGLPVGLSGSQVGVNYQLQIGGINTGLAVAGTGAAISFGNKTAAGTYTVIATLTATGCTRQMNGNVIITILPLPATSAIFHL